MNSSYAFSSSGDVLGTALQETALKEPDSNGKSAAEVKISSQPGVLNAVDPITSEKLSVWVSLM